MKNIIASLVCVMALVSASLGQTNALKNQSALYGNWVAHSTNTVASGAQTIVPDFCYFNATEPPAAGATNGGATTSAGRQFFPFATNTAITIVDGANTETVTPSSVVAPAAQVGPAVGPYACSFTATLSNAHSAGVSIVSGDGGIGEAANDSGAAYGLYNGVIPLNGRCTGTANATAGIYGLTGINPTNSTILCNSTAVVVANVPGTVIPRAGLLKSLSVTATAAGTNASSGAVTINKNGVATALTCTVGTGTSCVDNTHSVVIASGDILSVTYTDQTSDTLAGLNVTALVY